MVILVAIAGATSYYRDSISVVEQRILEALAPIQRAATETGRSIRVFWESLAELRNLRDELARLRTELDRLAALEPLLAEAQQETSRLQEMLGFAPPQGLRGVAAKVIGRSLSNWFSTVEINRGMDQGVTVNCAVVTHYGLVGKVVRVTASTATVMLLVDPQSGLGAQIVRSREPGAVIGDAGFRGTCTMRMFSRDADVVAGDAVFTSGLGDVYPPSLHVGTVTGVRRDEQGLLVVAEIAPAVDFGRLEEVFVLLPQ